MKFSTVSACLVMSAMMGGVSNVSAMNGNNDDRVKRALDSFYSPDWVPSMVNVPREQLKKSAENANPYTCIPSGRCYGSCCAPSNERQSQQDQSSFANKNVKLNELAQAENDENRKEALSALKDALKKLVACVGKSEAVKIAQAAVDESSSDSDTESSVGSLGSLGGRSPKDFESK